jgi:putative acetyltransferase
MKIQIRPEITGDIETIKKINTTAFETEAEAGLVDALRDSGIPLISLVAEVDQKIVGHILFSPIALSGKSAAVKIAGLAPMAVMPDHQKQGIGSALVKKGLKQCKSEGYQAAAVLGYPEYYPRFGFVPCSRFGIKSEYDVPDEVFMVKELVTGILAGYKGVVKYHSLFAQLR